MLQTSKNLSNKNWILTNKILQFKLKSKQAKNKTKLENQIKKIDPKINGHSIIIRIYTIETKTIDLILLRMKMS